MHIDDFKQVVKKLEPDAWAGGDGLEPFAISIAVSLKRIGDAIEKIADATRPLNNGGRELMTSPRSYTE